MMTSRILEPKRKLAAAALFLACMLLLPCAFATETHARYYKCFSQLLKEKIGNSYSGPRRVAFDAYVNARLVNHQKRRNAFAACVKECESNYESDANSRGYCKNTCVNITETMDK